jgi:integrase
MASVRKLNLSDPDSPWVCEYTDAAGRRRRKTPKSGLKKDAEAIRRRVEAELGQGQRIPHSQAVTVAALCDAFLKFQDQRLAEGEIARNRKRVMKQAIDGQLIPALGNKLAISLTLADVEGWYGAMIRRGLSPATARGYLLVAKMAGDFGVKRQMLNRNAFAEAMRERKAVPPRKIRTFDLDEARRLLKPGDSRGYRCGRRNVAMMHCAVNLAALCGLRWGEIMGLAVPNVDLKDGFIRVRHSLTRDDELKGPKTAAGVRDVPLPGNVASMLSEWIDRHYRPNERKLLFRAGDGDAIEHGSFMASYRRLLLRAGVTEGKERLRFHALRHFASSLMIDLGFPLTEVADLLGHETFDTTLQVYAHSIVSGHRRRDLMQAMAEHLSSDADGPVALPAPDATKTRQDAITH